MRDTASQNEGAYVAYLVVDPGGPDCRLGGRQDHEGIRLGALGDILIGIVGAVIGGWIMGLLGFSGHGGTIYTILVAILGAVILVWIIRKIKRA